MIRLAIRTEGPELAGDPIDKADKKKHKRSRAHQFCRKCVLLIRISEQVDHQLKAKQPTIESQELSQRIEQRTVIGQEDHVAG